MKNTSMSRSYAKMIKREHKYSFRISQGIYKGLSLEASKDSNTRPTKSLVKKSFFDTVRFSMRGCIFIECFAGSGQMGFEALSLGADRVIFFEKQKEVFLRLEKNIATFKSRANDIHIDSYNMDFLLSRNILANQILRESILKNDIITSDLSYIDTDMTGRVIMYIDPPFSCRDGFQNIYMDIKIFLESLESLLECVGLIVIEMMSDVEIFDSFGMFRLCKISKFGKTSLAYFN